MYLHACLQQGKPARRVSQKHSAPGLVPRSFASSWRRLELGSRQAVDAALGDLGPAKLSREHVILCCPASLDSRPKRTLPPQLDSSKVSMVARVDFLRRFEGRPGLGCTCHPEASKLAVSSPAESKQRTSDLTSWAALPETTGSRLQANVFADVYIVETT